MVVIISHHQQNYNFLYHLQRLMKSLCGKTDVAVCNKTFVNLKSAFMFVMKFHHVTAFSNVCTPICGKS